MTWLRRGGHICFDAFSPSPEAPPRGPAGPPLPMPGAGQLGAGRWGVPAGLSPTQLPVSCLPFQASVLVVRPSAA